MSIASASANPVAIYGALVSTLVAGWNVYLYFARGPKLAIAIIPNQTTTRSFFEGQKVYLFVAIANRGTAEITITGLSIFAYKNLLGRLRGKGKVRLIEIDTAASNPMPYRLGVGHEFNAFVIQDSHIEEWSRNHRAYLFISHSMANKPLKKRLYPFTSLAGGK